MVRSAGPSVGQSPNLQCVRLVLLYVGKLQVTVRLTFLMTVEVHLPVAFCVPFTLLGTRRSLTPYSLFYSIFPCQGKLKKTMGSALRCSIYFSRLKLPDLNEKYINALPRASKFPFLFEAICRADKPLLRCTSTSTPAFAPTMAACL